MSLSVRGIARRFLNRTGAFSVHQVFFGSTGGTVMLRERLESLARQEISFDVSECVYAWTARYQQTWSHVRVRVQLNPDAGISAATMATLRTAWENGIETRWSNRWGIGRPGEITCPLTFDVEWVTSNAHHTVRVQTGPARSNMTLWDTSDTGDVAAHEFGHMHGNPDEYTDAACPGRNPVNTGTVMDNNSNNLPQRLMQRLVDNVGSNVV
ncbi:MAG: hypothetical protein ACRERE_37335 [Candidatus Entotheonellia bacterium]